MGFKKWTKSSEQLKPDSRFSSTLVSKFINCMMWDGKKTTSERNFYTALDIIGKKMESPTPVEVFTQAIDNIKPAVEVRSKRVGGANYQVPVPVNRKRQQSLAIRWVLQAIRAKSGRPISQSLAEELMAAFKKEGTAMQTRDNQHRMADANKAFAHFAW